MKQTTDQYLQNRGLVLEGGAMRGVFTCGVLDWLMDNDVHFPYVIGVSAGACNGASYISNQRGRAKFSNVDLLDKYHYIGVKHYLKKRNLLDFDLLFNDFPNHILPFDFDTYANVGKRFEMVVSNCVTGQAEYLEEYTNHDRLLNILRASSSMPFFSPIVELNGVPLLDGGVCDSIPVMRAMEEGFENNIVVLTRNKGYRKKEINIKLPRWVYRKYPMMREALDQRNVLYNAQLDLVDKLEDEGRVIVVRPEELMTIERIEKDTAKLEYFYEHGYHCAEHALSSVLGSLTNVDGKK